MPVVDLRFSDTATGVSLRGRPPALRQLAAHLRDAAVVQVQTGIVEIRLVADESLLVGLDDGVLSLSGRGDIIADLRRTLHDLADQAETAPPGAMLCHAHFENLGPEDDQDVAARSTPLLITADWPWGAGGERAFRPLAEATEWSSDLHDERARHGLIQTALRANLPGGLVRGAVAGEPRQSVAALVILALDLVEDDEHPAWLALVPGEGAAACRRRSDEVALARRAARGQLVVCLQNNGLVGR